MGRTETTRSNHPRRTVAFAIGAIALLALPLGGCVRTESQSLPEAAAATEWRPEGRYGAPGQPPFPEYPSVKKAQKKVGWKIRVPAKRPGKLQRVVVRTRTSEGKQPKVKRAVDLHYEQVEISEVPFETPWAARDKVESVLRTGELAGYATRAPFNYSQTAISWERSMGLLARGADGAWIAGLRVPENAVMWADGKMVYRIASESVGFPDLWEIAESMYDVE